MGRGLHRHATRLQRGRLGGRPEPRRRPDGQITPIEIELAVADFDCREEVDYDKVQLEVTADAQQQFYDAHKDELEAWREGALAARG